MRLEKCLHKNDHDIPVVYMNLKFLEKKSNRYILVVVSQAHSQNHRMHYHFIPWPVVVT